MDDTWLRNWNKSYFRRHEACLSSQMWCKNAWKHENERVRYRFTAAPWCVSSHSRIQEQIWRRIYGFNRLTSRWCFWKKILDYGMNCVCFLCFCRDLCWFPLELIEPRNKMSFRSNFDGCRSVALNATEPRLVCSKVLTNNKEYCVVYCIFTNTLTPFSLSFCV